MLLKKWNKFYHTYGFLLQIIRTKSLKKYLWWSSIVLRISECSYPTLAEPFYFSYFLENIFSNYLMSDLPVDIQLKSNVHRCPYDVIILGSCALKIKFLCPKCSCLKLARFLIMSFVKILLINCSKSNS